jgi:pseudouridine-5'-phosphate glycosidase
VKDPATGRLAVADDVREALASGRPVVALESTIFTHGLPRPRNVEVALAAEDSLRTAGVCPATIGVVGGRAVVGLATEQIQELGSTDEVVKLSLRDLPVATARGRSGGTTVAATAFLAARAGIPVFATGGLGGVHRGASRTFDESADLPLLAHTPILVVAAGVKSILDIGASLERLETLSVTLVGYRTTSFPGFYVADSGFRVDDEVGTPAEAAALVHARDALGVPGAILVANPVPEQLQLDPVEHARVLGDALAAADRAGVVGHDTTPYLLDHLHRSTRGRTLEVNVAVYENNVRLAGEIALALSALYAQGETSGPAAVSGSQDG